MIFNDKEYNTREELESDDIFASLGLEDKEKLVWMFWI